MLTKDNFRNSQAYHTVQDIIKGVDLGDLPAWLESEKSDFFYCPASTKYHSSYPGGLAVHSINVYEGLKLIADRSVLGCTHDSIVICGLFHDIGKTNFYVLDEEGPTTPQLDYLKSLYKTKEMEKFEEAGLNKSWASDLIDWVKTKGRNGSMPEKRVAYKVLDNMPLGPAVRSLSILQDFLNLSVVEKLAVRWHEGMYETSNDWAFSKARNEYPLVPALMLADFEAAFLREVHGQSKDE